MSAACQFADKLLKKEQLKKQADETAKVVCDQTKKESEFFRVFEVIDIKTARRNIFKKI